MRWRDRYRSDPGSGEPAAESGFSAALRTAFVSIARYRRLLLYDVTPEDAPWRLSRTGISLRGSARWQAYLSRRRDLDDGDLTLVLALRHLQRAERLLAVDWGTAHANAFLLIEPIDPSNDLSDPNDPAAIAALRLAENGREEDLVALLRSLYGSWVYWPAAPATEDSWRRVELRLDRDSPSLFECLQTAMRTVYPPHAFQEQLNRLVEDESELFAGRTIERARSPFLTRLGLPAVYEPSLVTTAVRHLVNEGRMAAFAPNSGGSYLGPVAPVPDDVPDELFERMLL
jgi:hypothetical protein